MSTTVVEGGGVEFGAAAADGPGAVDEHVEPAERAHLGGHGGRVAHVEHGRIHARQRCAQRMRGVRRERAFVSHAPRQALPKVVDGPVHRRQFGAVGRPERMPRKRIVARQAVAQHVQHLQLTAHPQPQPGLTDQPDRQRRQHRALDHLAARLAPLLRGVGHVEQPTLPPGRHAEHAPGRHVTETRRVHLVPCKLWRIG
jgi:hypothetical protein